MKNPRDFLFPWEVLGVSAGYILSFQRHKWPATKLYTSKNLSSTWANGLDINSYKGIKRIGAALKTITELCHHVFIWDRFVPLKNGDFLKLSHKLCVLFLDISFFWSTVSTSMFRYIKDWLSFSILLQSKPRNHRIFRQIASNCILNPRILEGCRLQTLSKVSSNVI